MKLKDVYKPNNHYKVIIKTITYNHSKYIQDTLNGVAIQETNFPFVNIVLEDHSTDGEQDIIRLWLERECNMSLSEHYDIPTADIIIAPHKSNKNCTFAVYFHKENLFHQKGKREAQLYPWRIKSEYEALCEGDDYWIDPLKLQKQVDFMESHPDYSLCFHDYEQLWPDGNRILISKKVSHPLNCSIKDAILSGGGYMATNSMLFRTQHIDNYPLWATIGAGDFPLMLILFHLGKVAHLNIVGSVYRVNSVGSWSERMNKISFLLQHVRQTDRMLRNFDNWSNKKYHKAILLKRIKNQLINIKLIFKIYCRKLSNCLK